MLPVSPAHRQGGRIRTMLGSKSDSMGFVLDELWFICRKDGACQLNNFILVLKSYGRGHNTAIIPIKM